MRSVRIRLPDESIRAISVPSTQPVANLMVLICTKLRITNHEEFSLINEKIKERHDARIKDQKMEQLKKRLKTEEDLPWLDHAKTLDEQEVHENDVVVLKRRFFYSEIDTRDPLQLGLLYKEIRDAILSGTHPINLDGACKFAGLQAQAQMGDFNESKQVTKLTDYLPMEYAKQKHIEKNISQWHKKYYGLSELEAKAKYIMEARSLPTYGATFFLVREKVPGKNKLVPRLLGIKKDSVMRVDADNKVILKSWPLITVKRWAASANTFTLDFGDYTDTYYSVQTQHGEQISHLMAGYIDIILKRRKEKDHFGIQGDEGATMLEDSVAPSRATIIANQTARPPSAAPSQVDLSSAAGPTVEKVLHEEGPVVEPPEVRPGFEIRGKAEIGYEARPVSYYPSQYELSLPQRNLKTRLEQAHEAVETAQKYLDSNQQQNDSTTTTTTTTSINRVETRNRLANQFANMNAATAQLVSLSAIPEEELDYPQLTHAVETVTSNLPSAARDIKIVAQLMDDDKLIEAARRLCKSFSDLLTAAEPGPTVPRQTLISAASRVGDATQSLLQAINGGREREGETGDAGADHILTLAKSVASSAAALVLMAKDVGSGLNEDLSNQLIGSATQCALATSQMVATAKIVAPTIHNDKCQRQLLDACRGVQTAVDGIQRSIRDKQLDDAAQNVHNALDELVDYVKRQQYQQRQQQFQHQYQPQQQHINNSSNSLNRNQHQTTTSNTTTTNSTTTLHQIMYDGQQQDNDNNNNANKTGGLIDEARNVARATTRLIQDLQPTSSSQHHNQHHHQSDNYQQQQQHYKQPRQQQQYENNKTTTQTTTTTTTTQEQRNQYQQQHQDYDPQQQNLEATISGIVSDLETTIVFATSGSLRAQDDQEDYFYNREKVLRCAKALVEEIRPLMSNTGDSGQLARAAQKSVSTLSQLADTVKRSAATLGPNNSEQQTLLIRSVKDVAVSLGDLIGSNRPDAAKKIVNSVTDLLRTVKSVEDEQQRGCRAIEEAIRLIEQEILYYNSSCTAIHSGNAGTSGSGVRSSGLSADKSTAEEILRVSRPLTMATAKTVQAGSTGQQDDAIVASNMGSKAAVDLLQTVLLVSQTIIEQQQQNSSPQAASQLIELRLRLQDCAKQCVVQYKNLIELLYKIFQHPSNASTDPGIKQELINQSKLIASSITELVNCGELLKGTLKITTNSNTITATTSSSSLSASNNQQQQQQQQQLYQQQASPNFNAAASSGGGGSGFGNQDAYATSTTTTTTTVTNNRQQRHFMNDGHHYDDPNDPTVIAESELFCAANSIDAAAKKLENLKPRVTSVKVSQFSDSLNR